MLPHAYPFRLVERAETRGKDRVTVILGTANGTLTAPGPWPCTLVAEALAQAILLAAPPTVRAPRLVGMSGVRVLRPVCAGERLEVSVHESGTFGGLRRYSCRALADGALAATAEITVSG